MEVIVPAQPDPQLRIVLATSTSDSEQPLVVTKDGWQQTLVATVTYTAGNPGRITNKILIVTNHSNPGLGYLFHNKILFFWVSYVDNKPNEPLTNILL